MPTTADIAEGRRIRPPAGPGAIKSKPRLPVPVSDDFVILRSRTKVKKPSAREIERMKQRQIIRKDPLHTI